MCPVARLLSYTLIRFLVLVFKILTTLMMTSFNIIIVLVFKVTCHGI